MAEHSSSDGSRTRLLRGRSRVGLLAAMLPKRAWHEYHRSGEQGATTLRWGWMPTYHDLDPSWWQLAAIWHSSGPISPPLAILPKFKTFNSRQSKAFGGWHSDV